VIEQAEKVFNDINVNEEGLNENKLLKLRRAATSTHGRGR